MAADGTELAALGLEGGEGPYGRLFF